MNLLSSGNSVSSDNSILTVLIGAYLYTNSLFKSLYFRLSMKLTSLNRFVLPLCPIISSSAILTHFPALTIKCKEEMSFNSIAFSSFSTFKILSLAMYSFLNPFSLEIPPFLRFSKNCLSFNFSRVFIMLCIEYINSPLLS